MQNNRSERIKELLRETAAEFLAREANRQSLITVTRVELSEDGSRAKIFFTVLPTTAEERALSFANRHRTDFITYFKKKIKGARTPFLEFFIDNGEKIRQRLDEITNDL